MTVLITLIRNFRNTVPFAMNLHQFQAWSSENYAEEYTEGMNMVLTMTHF